MGLIKAKQINRVLGGYIRVPGITAEGVDDVITADLTSILATAGFDGGAVPLQISADVKSEGIITVGNNRVEIYDDATGDKIDFNSNEIYGRITEAAGVYTLSYFFIDGGVETVHDFTASTDIAIEFAYRFKLGNLPTDIFIGLTIRNVQQDIAGGGGGGSVKTELVSITGLNVIADLSLLPDPTANVTLIVNGQTHDSLGPFPSFSMSGKQVTWIPGSAGFDMTTTKRLVAVYTTLE